MWMADNAAGVLGVNCCKVILALVTAVISEKTPLVDAARVWRAATWCVAESTKTIHKTTSQAAFVIGDTPVIIPW